MTVNYLEHLVGLSAWKRNHKNGKQVGGKTLNFNREFLFGLTIQWDYLRIFFWLTAEGHFKTDIVGAIVEPSFVIICVTVSSRALLVNQVHVFGVDDRPTAALFWGNWWCWAAEVKTRVLALWLALTVRWRVVPFLAWGQALNGLSVLDHSQITDVVFVGGTRVQRNSARSCCAWTLLFKKIVKGLEPLISKTYLNAGDDFGG